MGEGAPLADPTVDTEAGALVPKSLAGGISGVPTGPLAVGTTGHTWVKSSVPPAVGIVPSAHVAFL